MPDDPEREGGAPAPQEIEAKEPQRSFIICDDKYADNLAGFFETESGEKPQTTQAIDLATALEAIDSIQDTRGVGVLTDMFMPEKSGTAEVQAGLGVVKDILEYFGVKPDEAQSSISRVTQVLERHKERLDEEADNFTDGME